MQKQIKELKSYFSIKDKKKESVSNATIGWQIDHILKVIFGVISSLQKSNPKDYQWKFNALRTTILTSGIIPRGKGKAPEVVNSKKEIFETAALEELLEKVNQKLIALEKLAPDAFFEHPYFGSLNKKNAIKFLTVHTEHHLKIIRDINK